MDDSGSGRRGQLPLKTLDAPGATTTENFSAFARDTFAKDANSTAVNFDTIVLVQDVDTDPTAFDALLM